TQAKAGTPEAMKSVNNIWRLPMNNGDPPQQVTHHTSGSLFWPSMTADGRMIVYEESFGLWKLDLNNGRKPVEGKMFTVATDKGDPRRVTRTPGARETSPQWSPDGKWIAFVSDQSGREEVW